MATHAVLPWVFAGLLAFIHHFGEHLSDTSFAHQDKIASFSAGVTITYVFLQLLPEFHKGIEHIGSMGAFSLLIGFSAIHLTEKWVYQHEKTSAEIRHDFKEIHSVFLFVYYAAIGFLLHELIAVSVVNGTLFFIPILFHTTISSFSLIELDDEILNNSIVRGLITLAVFLGTGTAALLPTAPSLFYLVLGGVTGMFLYVVIHDSMPTEDSGKPSYFLLGLAFYSAVMAYIWLMF